MNTSIGGSKAGCADRQAGYAALACNARKELPFDQPLALGDVFRHCEPLLGGLLGGGFSDIL